MVERIDAKPALPTKKRVCAYARVSTGKDAMMHSLSAQVSYYSNLIQSHAEWIYTGVYADEATTGTKSTRPEFNKMLSDARHHKIDIILVKSISRFARNTVTLLSVTRELKSLGVDVYFEEQNINSLSSEGELMLSLLASFAQEESRSVSLNTKWRINKNFKEGKLAGGWNGLGYTVNGNEFKVVKEEAKIIKEIFAMYLRGMGTHVISDELNKNGYKTKLGYNFYNTTVLWILKNEVYTGTLLLQKSFIENHLTKKRRINTCEKDMYMVENHHEAIIDKAEFLKVQELIKERTQPRAKKAPLLFTGLIICSCCGHSFSHKRVNGIDVWVCNGFVNKGKSYCSKSYRLREDILKSLCTEVLGLTTFDELIIKTKITKIVERADRILEFYLSSGEVKSTTYQNKSRSLSWSKEKREEASENAKRQSNSK